VAKTNKSIKKARKEKRIKKKSLILRTLSKMKGEPRELKVVTCDYKCLTLLDIERNTGKGGMAIFSDRYLIHDREDLLTFNNTPNFFVLNTNNMKLLAKKEKLEAYINSLQDQVAYISRKFTEPVTVNTKF